MGDLPLHQPAYTTAGSDFGRTPDPAGVECVCGWAWSGPRQMDCQLAFGQHLIAQQKASEVAEVDVVLPCGCVPPCEGHHEDES